MKRSLNGGTSKLNAVISLDSQDCCISELIFFVDGSDSFLGYKGIQ